MKSSIRLDLSRVYKCVVSFIRLTASAAVSSIPPETMKQKKKKKKKKKKNSDQKKTVTRNIDGTE